MTCRERLFRALRGQPTDRVPVWLLFPYHPTGYYADVRSIPCYRPVLEASLGRAIVLDRRNLKIPWWTQEVCVHREEVEEKGEHVQRTVWRWGNNELVSEIRRGPDRTFRRWPVETDADLDRLLSMPVETDRRYIEAALRNLLPRYLEEREEFPLEMGAMMLDQGEPIGCLHAMSGPEALALWSVERPEAVTQFLDRCMAYLRCVYEFCLCQELAEVYFLVGSELAAPPLVAPETFRRWVVPYARELIERVHHRGGWVIQHFHGAIRAVLPEFPEMGADALHTIEAPPVGDCTMSEAYEITGDRMTLIGNVQYDELRVCSEAALRERVGLLLDECRGHRFILSPTAGPYEPEIPERMVRNYQVLLDTAWDYPWSEGQTV